MTRRRRDRIFLFASAAAGFGGIVVLPVLSLMLGGLFAARFLGWQATNEGDERVTLTCLLVGLALGLLVGPAVHFVLSGPTQRRSPYHWWRLVRVYLLATIPVAALCTIGIWSDSRMPWSSWDVGMMSWIVLVPLICWLPDLYRSEMPKIRTGFYRRAHWVRRNNRPAWFNAVLALLMFGCLSLLMVLAVGGILHDPLSIVRLSYSNTRAPLIITIALCLAVPYIAARSAYSLLTWRLVDDGRRRCPGCGFDLTTDKHGNCAECGTPR